MNRLLFAAPQSGSGKTVVTCAFLRALQRRGVSLRAFKSGPDYIDPMFHQRVLGVPSRNLDLFLSNGDTVRSLLAVHAKDADLAVIEGAMGFYDGVGGTTDRASAWDLARETGTPVVLVVAPQGSGLTLAASLTGLRDFRRESGIAGILLNRCKPAQAAMYRELLGEALGLPVLGYLPPMEEAAFASRHLGLVQAGELEDYRRSIDAVARQMERTVDLDALLRLAGTAEPCPGAPLPPVSPARTAIAVAMDEAFSFYYADNLDLLRRCGAEILPFSPLRDRALPEGARGLYLGGGYPELHARQLSQNAPMRACIRSAIESGMPVVAECGGFLYLQRTLEDGEGRVFPMVGALPGAGYQTQGLRRFGYLTLEAGEDSLLFRKGEPVPAHEFHYWDCTENGEGLAAEKPVTGRSWRCGVTAPRLYAGFPHLYFYADPRLARRFAEAAADYQNERRSGE